MKVKKNKRNVLADSDIVEAFWKIVEPEKSVRLKNVELIVKKLVSKEPTYKDGEIFPDLEYTLKRLVSGLASSRKAARQGFAVALAEILRCFWDRISPKHAITLIWKLIPLSNVHGERHASVIGQILAFQVLICSGKLPENPTCLPTVLETVLKVSNKKSYVEHASCLVLQELLTQVSPELFAEFLWPILSVRLQSGQESCTPQDLWLLLICSRLFPQNVGAEFLQTHWKTSNLYSSDNLPFIAKLLKKSTLVHPRVHPLCSELIQQVTSHKRKIFKEFWNLVVNDTLLGLNQFEEAYLVFELVKLTLPKLKNAKYVKCVLSPKLRDLFIRSIKTRHSPLYSTSSELCDFLVEYAGKVEDPEVQFSILKAFIKPPGTLLFDQIARKFSVQSLIAKLKFEAIKEYAEVLGSTLLGEGLEEDQNLSESLKCHAARQLCRLSGHPLADGVWKSGVLQQLFLHGFFNIVHQSEDIPWCGQQLQLSEPVKEACRLNFQRGLELLQNPPVKKGFWGRFHHQREALSPLLDYAHLLLESPHSVQPINNLESLHHAWLNMHSMLKKVRRWSTKEEENHERQSALFEIFYLQIAFQLFYDFENTQKILNELNECCKRSLKSWRHSRRQREQKTDPDEPHWADVIMDLMLSLLSDKSQFLRGIVNSVFPAVCPYITMDSLRLLIEAVNPNTDDPLSNNHEEEEVEFESGSSSDSDDNENETMVVDEKFRHQVKSALGDAADNSDQEEDDLSDSEMFKLDDALSEAFRLRMKPSKKDKMKDDEAQTHFRLRCLELMEKYAKSEMRLCLALAMIEPLVAATKKGFTNRKLEGLSTKACNILRIITATKKFRDKNDVQMEDLKLLLKSLLSTIQKVSDSKFKAVLSQLCSLVINCTQNLDKSARSTSKQDSELGKWYLDLCTELFKCHFDKGTCDLSTQLFDHLFLACEDHVWELFESLQAVAFQVSTRNFKRTQAYVLLASMITKISKQSKSTEDKMRDFCSSLIPKSTTALKESLQNGVKPTYTCKLLLLLQLLLLQTRPPHQDNHTAAEQELLEAVSAVPLKKLDRAGKKASHKIQALLQKSAGSKPSKKLKRKWAPSVSQEIQEKRSKDIKE